LGASGRRFKSYRPDLNLKKYYFIDLDGKRSTI